MQLYPREGASTPVDINNEFYNKKYSDNFIILVEGT
jgi:hypothetical protein